MIKDPKLKLGWMMADAERKMKEAKMKFGWKLKEAKMNDEARVNLG